MMKKIIIFSFFILFTQTKYIVPENISLSSHCNEMSILDSLRYVTIMTGHAPDIECKIIIPNGQGGYFVPENEESICKALMAPQMMPCLIEKVKDTTFVKEMFDGMFNYTISDVTIELIMYILSGKFDITVSAFREFSKGDMVDHSSFMSYRQSMLHHSIFVANTPDENYNNRIKFYNAVKEFYEKEN
ncbi:MAG: hypothetical protein LBC84_02395 [Prevotellaceae bacterium]|jgi:hypothetical protein|nr:hypothetical protein [Prevotellaceae bacterium]